MTLTIKTLSFTPGVNYTLFVKLINTNKPIATQNATVKFRTSLPPSGGSVQVTPGKGVVNMTVFNVKIVNWKTSNPPLKFRVWSSDFNNGYFPSALLTPEWTNASASVNFTCINIYPFQVEVSDASNESSYF
jgi:hypothetical protein